MKRSKSKMRNNRRSQAHLRYKKQRQRNVLASAGAHDFVLILDHLKAGFNVAKIFRSAQAFGAKAVHLLDIGEFDPAPAKGAFKYVPAKFYTDFAESYAALNAENYTFYCLEPDAPSILSDISLAKNAAFIFGNEEFGIDFDLSLYPDIQRVSIPQFGNVQSLNVSVAASICMYEYIRQNSSSNNHKK